MTLKHKYNLSARTFTTLNSVSTTDSSSTYTGAQQPQLQLQAASIQLTVTDEQPSISVQHSPVSKLPQIEFKQQSPIIATQTTTNTSSTRSAYDQFKQEFYTEIAERLQKLVNGSLSNGKSSMSSIDLIDIPYIDEDESSSMAEEDLSSSSYDEAPIKQQHQSQKTIEFGSAANSTASSGGNSSSSSTSSTSSSSASYMGTTELTFDGKKLNELIAEPTYERFDQFTQSSTLAAVEPESVWNKVAVMFELTNRALQEILASGDRYLEDRDTRVHRLKETAASYIHDKYCDWIYENGGWVTH